MIVCGEMVVNTCMSMRCVSGSCCWVHSLWLTIRITLVLVSFLAVILANCMASKVVCWSVGRANPFRGCGCSYRTKYDISNVDGIIVSELDLDY